jgi:hypothetical protein
MTAIRIADLHLAYDFVSVAGLGEHQVFLDRQSGEFHYHSELAEVEEEELPEDIDDEKYIEIPHKHELNLGRAVVEDFVLLFLPEDCDEVRRIFKRRGAYGRFKALLARRGALERWYDFENKTEEAALRDWCEANEIELAD